MPHNHSGANPDRNISRLFAVDALRGLIIVLMALDHANALIARKHASGEHWGGAFPSYVDALPFLTRFVTHICAPGFSFLMGIGMVMFANFRRKRGWSEWAIIRHFLIRGSFLILLQLIIVNRAWIIGSSPFPTIYIGVLVALGGGMIFGSFLLHLRPNHLLVLAVLLFIGTELLHPSPDQWGRIFDRPLGLLFTYSGGDSNFWSNYPILPWLELVLFGQLFGHWLLEDSRKAFRRGLQLGGTFLIAFVLLRTLDGFGNIRPRMGNSWIDFFNVVKYPPAMTFTLLTMGINLLILGFLNWADERVRQIFRPLIVFGQVPMFFYILHLYFYAGLGLWLTPEGTSIPAMIPYWLLGLLILYPLCLGYAQVKRRASPNSPLRFL